MRDELWKQAIKKTKESGSVLQIWTDQNPQGFSFRQYGESSRSFVDIDGMSLIQIMRESKANLEENDNIDPEEE